MCSMQTADQGVGSRVRGGVLLHSQVGAESWHAVSGSLSLNGSF